MNNLKTALTVVLLLGALYGAYQVLNYGDVPPPAEAQLQMDQGIAPPMIEFGTPGGDFGPVPVNVPSTDPAVASPVAISHAQEAPIPSFTVMPPREAPKFDALPQAEASPAHMEETVNVAQPAASVATEDAQLEPERSAYAAGAVQVASRDETIVPKPSASLQDNPWYRPQKNPAANAPVGGSMSPEAAKQVTRAAFERAWTNARSLVEDGKLAQALAELTVFYDSPDLTTGERQQLQKTLDSLAGRVIYSSEHYLEAPHVVRGGETLMEIAGRYNVQWQLLQNINGVRDPNVLVPKTELKIVRGPFRAEVSLQTSYLTLFVDKYYAGRFPVTIGRDPMPPPGTYSVRDKREGRDYYLGGKTIAKGRPENPYGEHWIDLGGEVCIHGSGDPKYSSDYGCISLAPLDAADVYGILSLGSPVVVKR